MFRRFCCASIALLPALTLAQDMSPKPNAQMQAVLTAMAKLNPKPIESLPPAQARLQPSAADGVIQSLQDKGVAAPDKLPPVAMVEMRPLSTAAGAVPVRIYTPNGDGPFPVLVYFHGGGWVIASLDTYDASCRGLCALNKAVVVSVDYRRAPEHKFPAAPEDCYAATQYVAAHAAEFGGDPKRLAVVGESAGGNLATVVCLMAAERGGKMPAAEVLVYPITNQDFNTPSYRENATAKPLNAAMMPWFFKHYLKDPGEGSNIFVSPLRATPEQLKALPPTTIVLAQIDPLRDDGVQYAEKLTAAGVDTECKIYSGVTHEFFGMALAVDEAKAANALVVQRLKAAWGG